METNIIVIQKQFEREHGVRFSGDNLLCRAIDRKGAYEYGMTLVDVLDEHRVFRCKDCTKTVHVPVELFEVN